MDDQKPVGRRVAYWRNRRKMSQQVFADRLGKSKSWVDKVERGVRRLDRFSIIDEIAAVLQLDVQQLLGDSTPAAPVEHDEANQTVEQLRAALEHYNKIIAQGDPAAAAPALAPLRAAVSHAWLTYQHSNYHGLAQVLPGLVCELQAAHELCHGADGREAARLLSQAYQIVASSLRKLGEPELAWLAAERAVVAAQHAQDELLVASSIAHVVGALAGLGRLRSALEISLVAANRLAPPAVGGDPPERLSLFGHLILQAAMAAIRLGELPTAVDLVNAAESAAEQLTQDETFYGATFGPTAVRLHRVAADVELGDMAQALATHDTIAASDLAAIPPECRAHHYLNVARACHRLGDLTRAAAALVEADRLAPAEIRRHPATERLTNDIVRHSPGAAAPALTKIADVLGGRPAPTPTTAR